MEKLSANSKIKLSNNTEIPVVGLGTYKLQGDAGKESVMHALEAGYRMIDTASRYENEADVARALSSFGLLREEIFITTKLWNSDQGYDSALKAIDDSLERLGVSYVDLYLVHWPTADPGMGQSINKRAETWRAMEEIYNSGKAKAIGVSNYTIEHLKEMEEYANIMPMVNQVEFHPFLYQKDLLDYCRMKNIVVEAYAPLTGGKNMEDERVIAIAKKHNKTIAHVLLRWGLQRGVVIIPRSSKKNHIKENINIFDFELDIEDMNVLDSLNQNLHIYPDPSIFQ